MWKFDEQIIALSNALLAGDVPAAQEILGDLRDLTATMPAAHYKTPLVDMMDTWLSYQPGDYQAAIDLMLHCQANFRLPYELGQLTQAKALLAMCESRWQEAIAHFAEVVQGAADLGTRWFQARALLDWAEAHLARLAL